MGIFGVGECGLPPKKENCYLADIDDCFAFMELACDNLEEKRKKS